MRRLLSILFSLTLLSESILSAQISDEDLARLDEMLDGYVTAISPEDIEVKNREVDFIMDTSRDSLLRDHVGSKLFFRYSDSPLMGDEAVAVHIYDRWFSTGEAHFSDEGTAARAMMFVQFNRSTLLGCKAPALHLRGLMDEDVILPVEGEQCLVFFYDLGCSKCRMETVLLRSYLRDAGLKLTLFAVYVGEDGDAWRKYCDEQFDTYIEGVRIIHAWDPEETSDFAFLYGVTGTPRMFLIDNEGIVTGRRLDTEALMHLFSVQKVQEELDARAPVGSMIADLRLPGIRVKNGKEKVGTWKLRDMDRIVFYVPGCNNCEQTIEEVRMPSISEKTLLVNLDALSSSDRELSREVLDTFDLTVIPYTIVLKEGRIIEKLR